MEDWLQQSVIMRDIYQNGDLNLVPTGFDSGEAGLFVERDRAFILPVSMKLPNRLSQNIVRGKPALEGGEYFIAKRAGRGEWMEEVDESPLNRRAWVVQKRILSRRTLHFGARQLYWQCFEAKAGEVFPHGYPRRMAVDNGKQQAPWLHSLRRSGVATDDDGDDRHERLCVSPGSALGYWKVITEACSSGS